ncbi:OmpL47-type beta-barrel domain-containing protein [Streptomyces vietnamensis]|uniref:OmpL47-type beta-barrel domain-containing protein n=1 Tax=Streptomyces vietnamensis TaxID=362257 RepID=UPI0037BBC16E
MNRRVLRAAREWSRAAVVALTVTLTIAASAAGASAESRPDVRSAVRTAPQAGRGGHLTRIEPQRRVDVRSLPHAVPKPGAATKAKPFMPAPKLTRPSGPALRPTVPVSTSALVKKPKAAPKAVSSTAVLERLKTFPTLGQDGKAPSDTQLAVGPTYILQMVNFTGQVYDKAGNTVGNAFDLGDFFGMAHRSGTDPRVHYDAAAGRFYAEFEADLSNGDRTDLAVSDSSDPRAGWTFYTIAQNTSNVLQDQAKLGYSNDKVTLSWNNYDRTTSPNKFLGVVTTVVNKAELLAGGTITIWTFNQDDTRFQVVPATSLSSVNDQFAMWHGYDSDSTNLRVLTITGVPGVSTVSQTENTFGIGTSDDPPSASQPSGGDAFIETNDGRMLSVAWQNNHLWGVFNVKCTPPGDTAERACQRYVQVSTGGTQSLVTNFNLGLVGGHIYFGSVAMNDEDDLFSGFTASSSSMFPTAVAIGVPGGNFPGTTVGDFYAGGTQAYVCGCGGDRRWGDYSGTARDPSNPKDVWTVQQIGGLAGGVWGTAMDRVTLSPPVVTGVVPNHGPELAQCVNTVTVRGRDFPTSGTTVKFGSVSASNVNVIGPEELTADAPPQARGTVDVTVTTANGTSPVTAADRYTYDADTSAPTASASISPSPNGAGWNTSSPATVNIGASDGSCGSGIQKITYSASGAQTIGSTDVSGASAAVPITTQGVTTVTFTATDNAGNTSAPQSITVRLDSVAPSITITSPTASTYLLNQSVNAAYSCSDATSGVATCAGPVASGSRFDTSTFGSHTFTVNATDVATNPSSKSVSYTVAYRICLLYDPLNPPRGGNSTIPIRLRICDANGVNLSSPNITLTPSAIVGPTTVPFTTPFRYDSRLRGYIVNVPTRDLANGSYNLRFTISGADTTTHLAPFTVR